MTDGVEGEVKGRGTHTHLFFWQNLRFVHFFCFFFVFCATFSKVHVAPPMAKPPAQNLSHAMPDLSSSPWYAFFLHFFPSPICEKVAGHGAQKPKRLADPSSLPLGPTRPSPPPQRLATQGHTSRRLSPGHGGGRHHGAGPPWRSDQAFVSRIWFVSNFTTLLWAFETTVYQGLSGHRTRLFHVGSGPKATRRQQRTGLFFSSSVG